jgi:hypothetical protein
MTRTSSFVSDVRVKRPISAVTWKPFELIKVKLVDSHLLLYTPNVPLSSWGPHGVSRYGDGRVIPTRDVLYVHVVAMLEK